VQSAGNAAHYLPLHCPKALQDGLQTLSQQQDASLFMVLLSALHIALYCYRQQPDVVIAYPVANRTDLADEQLLGCMSNLLLNRARLQDNPDLLSVLQRVREDCLQAYANQDVPFVTLVENIVGQNQQNVASWLQVVFEWLNVPTIKPLQLAGLAIREWPVQLKQARYDLHIVLRQAPDNNGLSGMLIYKQTRFSRSAAEQIRAALLLVLQQLSQYPQQHLNDLVARFHENFQYQS